MRDNEQIKIIVCMGSSCFARGNNENLDYLEDLIAQKKLDAKIELSGARCENNCAIGPNITIGDKIYNNVTKAELEKLLEEYLLIKN